MRRACWSASSAARAFADLTLQSAFAHSQLGARDRAFATELVYGTLRWRGRLDHMLRHALDRELDALEPGVLTLLRLGAYQILFCDSVPASAAVDQTVRSARALGAERATGLVNAVLRRLAQQAPTIPLPALADAPQAHLEHALGLPAWIAARWLAALGPVEAAALAEASNAAPPITARTNRTRITREALLARVITRFPEARSCAYAPAGIVLGHGGAPASDPCFVEGLFSVQDEASQLVLELLAPAPGERILDTCAAPGTKTTAIAERVGPSGLVVALDRSAQRLALVGRSRAPARARQRDRTGTRCDPAAGRPAGRSLRSHPGRRALLGSRRPAPQSRCALAGFRRRPGAARPRRSPRCSPRARSVLRPGGTLVYSTCTLTPEENDEVVAKVLAREPGLQTGQRRDAARDAAPAPRRRGGVSARWPHRHGMDGFFAVRMEQSP